MHLGLARPSAATTSLIEHVQARVMPRFEGAMAAFASGSRAMGFTDAADLDITVVWPAMVPRDRLLALAEVIDLSPEPVGFDLPDFRLDRIWVDGQQVDVLHRQKAEIDDWWGSLSRGEGWRRNDHPWPIVAISGLRYSVPVLGQPELLVPGLAALPAALTQAVQTQVPTIVGEHLILLEGCAARGDGLLFHSLLADAVHCVLIAAFAARGHYYPFAKWLPQWLEVLGLPREIGELERELWLTPSLPERVTTFRALVAASI